MIKATVLSLAIWIAIFKVNAQTYNEHYTRCTLLTKDSSLTLDLIAETNECMVGAPIPNFLATSINNDTVELAKLKGQVVVLNFWNTKCKPCIEEMPQLNKLVKSYEGKNVTFISLAPEDVTTLKQFLQKHAFDFMNIANAREIRTQIFKLEPIFPYTVIIDKQGKVKKMWFGTGGENETLESRYKTIINECL